jgi:AAA+ superfamily predicted ATPase
MKQHPPGACIAGPYAGSGRHLRDELARVDFLVRAQVVRWQMMIAAHKPEQLWGMVHVTEAEIVHYLAAPAGAPDHVPDEVLDVVQPFQTAEIAATARIRRAVAETPPSVDLRLERLCNAFGLGEVERDVVLLCLLPEIDVRYRRIFGYLQDDASRSHPSVELVCQVVSHKTGSLEASRAMFEPNQSLVRHHVIGLKGDSENRSGRFAHLDDRIVSTLLGSDQPDSRLRGIVADLVGGAHWDQLFADPGLIARLREFADHAIGESVLVVLHGPQGSGREKAARTICTHRGLRLLRFDVEAALNSLSRFELLVDLVYREAILLRSALYVRNVERLQGEQVTRYAWNHLLRAAEAFPGITFFATAPAGEASRLPGESRLLRFEFRAPSYELRRKLWDAVLPPDTDLTSRDQTAASLAAAFQITEGQVREAVAAALAAARQRSLSEPRITQDDLYEACRKQAGRRLLGFARRIEPTRRLTLDDVILSEPNKTQLRELMDRIRLRSRIESEMGFGQRIALGSGLVVLFAGPSGSGKTLCAELLANQQGVDLYKVDLSAIVSKWVGETEKNLSRVFAEAEDSDALLFFDECDSLFGQRGEVASEASGRWANLQVNYLLQRVEEYSGVVIMATNLRQNIDDAFTRRIQVTIEFATPDPAMRLQIWKRILPPGTNAILDDELRVIADRFALTGGSVRNASVDAAFRALADGRKAIVARDVLDGIAREYQKLGLPITQGEFGEQFYNWALADILAPAPRPGA